MLAWMPINEPPKVLWENVIKDRDEKRWLISDLMVLQLEFGLQSERAGSFSDVTNSVNERKSVKSTGRKLYK